MPTSHPTSITTRGIRVEATAFFMPEKSNPDAREFLFGYTITLENTGDVPAQLLSRHWVIIDAHGRQDEVRGPGVVGQTPRLAPGQSFQYQSYCPLRTGWGTMEGTYRFRDEHGESFDVQIPRFYLVTPKELPVNA